MVTKYCKSIRISEEMWQKLKKESTLKKDTLGRITDIVVGLGLKALKTKGEKKQ